MAEDLLPWINVGDEVEFSMGGTTLYRGIRVKEFPKAIHMFPEYKDRRVLIKITSHNTGWSADGISGLHWADPSGIIEKILDYEEE